MLFLAAALLFAPHYEITVPSYRQAFEVLFDAEGNTYFAGLNTFKSWEVTKVGPDGSLFLTGSTRDADPEIFAANGRSAYDLFAINEDGTINSSDHPASLGSVIAVYLSGGGLLTPGQEDGTRGGSGHQEAILPVQAVFRFVGPDGYCCSYGGQAQVVYAGSAPTLAAGVMQVNVKLPSSPLENAVSAGDAALSLTLGDPDTGYSASGGIWYTSTSSGQ